MSIKPKLLITTKLPLEGISQLKSHFELVVNETYPILSSKDLHKYLSQCDAVISIPEDQLTGELISSCPDLKLIAQVAVGCDNIDVNAATKCGVLITNTPGVLSETTADLTFALVLACGRHLIEADNYLRQGKWTGFSPDLMLGTDVHGKTLGIVGMGRIGRAVARRAKGFNMRVIYSGGRECANYEAPVSAQPVALKELLLTSDYIVLTCPLTEKTRGLIGKNELALVKPTAFLINTAHGAIVDEEALITALKSNKLAGAGLDVFAREPEVRQELINMPQVVLAPHMGSATVETRTAMAWMSINSVMDAFKGNKPDNCVNPEVWDRFLKRF